MNEPMTELGFWGAGEGWGNSFLERGAYVQLGGGWVLVAWGEAWDEDSPGEEGVSFFAPDFLLHSQRPWRTFPRHCIARGEAIANLLRGGGAGEVTWDSPGEDAFCQAVDRALGMIRGGEIDKAVPTAAMTSAAAATGKLKKSIVSNSLLSGGGGTAYGFWDRAGGIVGVTPESLFRREEREFFVDAVAGTGAGCGMWTATDKDRLEHSFVLRDIVERCRALPGACGLEVGATRAARTGSLCHLKTVVKFRSTLPSGFPLIVDCLHPTPAVGISPRGDWRGISRELDVGQRWRHGAPFGVRMGDGSLECCLVALRCVQWKEGEMMQIRAGCGVVRESTPGGEHLELQAKFAAIRQALGI